MLVQRQDVRVVWRVVPTEGAGRESTYVEEGRVARQMQEAEHEHRAATFGQWPRCRAQEPEDGRVVHSFNKEACRSAKQGGGWGWLMRARRVDARARLARLDLPPLVWLTRVLRQSGVGGRFGSEEGGHDAKDDARARAKLRRLPLTPFRPNLHTTLNTNTLPSLARIVCAENGAVCGAAADNVARHDTHAKRITLRPVDLDPPSKLASLLP
ncbi:hypothetical protein PENSPDRAFT_670204 [Peniophora sp. CONT]|nr:hypothetical protein PENSPDRAFT_670204 [Peniophora sp. CONT]